MADLTTNYGLQKLGSGEPLSTNSYKFVGQDRDLIDRLLYIGAVGHHHDGATYSASNPTTELTLTLDTTAGVLPANTRIFYKYVWVDSYGNETAPGPEAWIDTPASIAVPQPPTLAVSSSGGSLMPGTYTYVLSAWEGISTQETRALNPTSVTITSGSANKITLTMPSYPAGATGFNVYKRGPGDSVYYWLTSVSSPTSSYEDNGAVVPSGYRSLPVRDTSSATNSVLLELPGAVPASSTWKIYRTFISGDYRNSFLAHVTEDNPVRTYFEDLGFGTSTGQPPTTSLVFPSPSKIDLATETTGNIPIANVPYPVEVELSVPGGITSGTKQAWWECEFETAEIMGVRAVVLDAPNANNMIVDIHQADLDTISGSGTTIFTTQANRPTINAGSYYSPVKVPNVTSLVSGDVLFLDIDQDGGAATPTASDLKVFVRMYVSHSSVSDPPTWT